MRYLFIVLFALALGLFDVGCQDALVGPVIAVNTSQQALEITNEAIFQVESTLITAAINKAPDAATARAERDKIVATFHPLWLAYDKARASWIIASAATAEAEALEKGGKMPNLANLTKLVAKSVADGERLKAAYQELSK